MPVHTIHDELTQYLHSIAKFHELSEEEERVLVEKAQSGDIISRDKLIKANLAFVVNVAQHYQNKGAEIMDLISVGNLSLILAINKYSINKNTRFRNYAFFYIKKNIIIELVENGKPIKVSFEFQQIAHKIKRAKQKLFTCNGVTPSIQQISQELDISNKTIIKIINELNCLPPFDIIAQDFESSDIFSYKDFLDVEIDDSLTLLIRDKLQRAFENIVNKLTQQESFILKSYLGLDGYKKQSFLKVAKDICKDQETVSKIYYAILHKVSSEFIEENLNLMQIIDI